jgi:hypothetical protein
MKFPRIVPGILAGVFTNVWFLSVAPIHASAQNHQAESHAPEDEFIKAIEDNSFYIEEAYNQEPGVVQHITSGAYFRHPHENLDLGFTQEWPLGGQLHQIGFTIPYLPLRGHAVPGVGDVLINYRYQLCGSHDWAAFAPRLSLIIPTGNKEKGLGTGVFGLQFNMPASKRISNQFTVHANGGLTILPGVNGTDASGNVIRQTLNAFNVGASVVWLARPNVNFLLEWITTVAGDFGPGGGVVYTSETILAPGFRCAVDVGDLQIVPGIAVPFRFAHGDSRSGVFFYLSFEHPY